MGTLYVDHRDAELRLDVPPEARGRKLSAGQIAAHGARLEEYRVERVE